MAAEIPGKFVGLEKSIQDAAKNAGRNLKINLGTSARSIEALSQPLGRITGRADEFTKSMEAANARVLAFGASVGVLRSVTNSFKELVATTIQVEKQMASINAILGASTGELSKFKKEIFDVARNTEQSFETVSTAALELSRQGLAAEEVVKRLNDALILSRLSGQSSADAVAGLTSAINGFKSAGITSADVVNKFSEAAKSAAVSERDLAEAFKRAGSVAGQAGVTFDELIGIVSAVQEKTSRGGSVIGNSFKTIFTRIQSLEKLNTMQTLGVQVTDSAGKVLSATKIIQNLAGVLESFPDARRLQIAENLVGKFQVAPFISLLEDYNDETSKAIKITEISANATTAAYERNTALNQTLSAAINQATVNVEQLFETLGKIGITDNLQNILGFFNDIVEGLRGLLDEETGSDIAKGLVKGIGNVISGPGLAIFAAIIGKLTKDLVSFGLGSMRTFFGLNKAAKEQAAVQGQIASTLLGNSDIQKRILAIENSQLSTEQKKLAQTKFFTTALNEQLAVMQRMQTIATRVAPGVIAGTRARRGAGGYIPNFAGGSAFGSEQADINRGVGGAPRSARPVAIPNFNFGGGQRGTMVANTSEFIVPNFGGGSAIFNQNMAASMGLPAGAKRVGAAGGYIPNFAKSEEGHYHSLSRQTIDRINQAAKIDPKGDQNLINKRAAAIRLQSERADKQARTFNAAEKGFVMVVPQAHGVVNESIEFRNPRDGGPALGKISKFVGQYYGINPNLKNDKTFRKFVGLEKEIKDSLAGAANNVAKNLAADIMLKPSPVTANNITELIKDEGGAGAIGAIQGAFFESITNAVIQAQKVDKSERGTLDFSLNPGNNRKYLEKIFNLPKGKFFLGDYKSSGKSFATFADQVISNVSKGIKATAKASQGYIPNFVGALENAIGREAAAGIPINQIRINQKGTLRNSANPMGLAVTNTRDEPTGAIPNFQGMNMNVQSGYAASGVGPRTPNPPQLTGELAKLTASGKELNNVNKKITESNKEVVKANRDMIGTIFAVQAGLSLLSGATSDAEQGIGRLTNRISDALGTATTGAFAGSALLQMGREGGTSTSRMTRMFSKLAGAAGFAAIGFGAVKGSLDLFDGIVRDATGQTDSSRKALGLLGEQSKELTSVLSQLTDVERLRIKTESSMLLDVGIFRDRRSVKEQTGIAGIRFPAGSGGSKEALDAAFSMFRGAGGTPREFVDIAKKFGKVGGEFGTEKLLTFEDNQKFEDFSKFINARVSEINDNVDAFFRQIPKNDKVAKNIEIALRNQRARTLGKKVPDTVENQDAKESLDTLLGTLAAQGLTSPEGQFARLRKEFPQGAADRLSGRTPEDILREQKALSIARLRTFGLGVRERNLTTFSPAEMAQMQGRAGLVGRGAISAANLAVNNQRFQETAVDDVIKGLEVAILKSPSLNVDPAQIQKGIEDLSKNLTFDRIQTEEQIAQVISRFLRVSGLDPLDVEGTGGQELTLLAKQIFEAQEQKRLLKEGNNESERIRRALEIGDASTAAGKAAIDAKNALEGGQLQLRALSAAGAFNRLRGRSELDFTRAIRDSGDNVFLQKQANEAKALRDTLISASETFANNITNGLVDAIVQGKSLGEVLRSAATDFFTMMSRAYMKKAVDSMVAGDGGGGGIVGFIGNMLGIKLNSGGMIRGGSGTRDDVPALLTGGEFVMRKSSVNKYGTGFMSALNQGAVPKFANGGMFVPGSYGQGSIRGKSDLLRFATQTGTSTAADRMVSGANFAAIALAPESIAMTSLGRSMSPAFQRTQEAKSQAFSLYVQQLQADEQRREQLRERERLKKQQRRGLFASLGMAALSGFVFGGGLGKLFGGRKTTADPVLQNFGFDSDFAPLPAPRALPVGGAINLLPTSSDVPITGNLIEKYRRPMGGMIPYMAGGGGVGNAAGVDTVPAM